MNMQKLFETIERITNHQCLESEMFEIINAVEDLKKIEQEQYENRKEIAKFDGSMLVRNYHTSWNALMPVVKKIQRLEISEFYRKKPVINALMDVDIKSIFKAVSVFVKWYNRNVAS